MFDKVLAAIVVLIVILTMGIVYVCVLDAVLVATDHCIISYPKEPVSGNIIYSYGSPIYVLQYNGKIERTGGHCLADINVTKERYERFMYQE